MYYKSLLFIGYSDLFPSIKGGLTFNSMLLHLVQGRFDVDPQAIGQDGFLRDGVVYAYFGIIPALLRLPLLAIQGFAGTDFTGVSCFAAVMLMALFKLLSLLWVWRSTGTQRGIELVAAFGIAILFGGPQVQFLRLSIYQEVCLWDDVFAAAFVYLLLRGYYSNRGYTGGLLSWLALAAGLCLLTRVSTALGLYVAFGLLWLRCAWLKFRQGGATALHFSNFAPLLASALIVIGFVAAAAVVNYQRWGSPFVFVPLQDQIVALTTEPDRLVRFRKYGDFNLLRVGYGLIYYFFPVWVLKDANGHLLWTAFQQRVIDVVELPPSSFLVSDPLLLGLGFYTMQHLIKYKDIAKPTVVLMVLGGLMIPIFLMLTAIDMAFRYRIEFYPFLEFAAFIGFGRLLTGPGRPRVGAFKAAAYTGVIVSLGLFYLYRHSPYDAPARLLAKTDIISFYRAMVPR